MKSNIKILHSRLIQITSQSVFSYPFLHSQSRKKEWLLIFQGRSFLYNSNIGNSEKEG